MEGDATGRGDASPLAKLSHGDFREEIARGVARNFRAQLAVGAIRCNHTATGIQSLIRRNGKRDNCIHRSASESRHGQQEGKMIAQAGNNRIRRASVPGNIRIRRSKKRIRGGFISAGCATRKEVGQGVMSALPRLAAMVPLFHRTGHPAGHSRRFSFRQDFTSTAVNAA
jgi:hypothetical protein